MLHKFANRMSARFILSIFTILSLTITAFSQTYTIQDGDTINFSDANGIKRGFWRYYWPNGDLKYEVYYENGEKEGLETKYYDAQDCIEFSNTYHKGNLDGPSVSFFPNCSVKCEEVYTDGIKSGYERCYDESGLIQTEGKFSKGELDGAYAHFDKKGNVTFESPTKETTLKFDKFLSGEYRMKDSTIFKVLQRNNWKNMLLVADMTGSMFPYIGQLIVWYKLNYESDRIKHYVLFNDGDLLPDDKKPIGNTGGVHMFDAKDFRKLKKDIEEVRKMGEGGDDPENDLEATYKAIQTYRDCKEIVLLADDSPVRDISLLRKIKKPIHVILCGTAKGINPEYLKIAYQSKGSIHTTFDDLSMKTLKDGQEFSLDNDIFRLNGNDFVWIDLKNPH